MQKTYKCPVGAAFKDGVPITVFVVRETTGDDEEIAAASASAHGDEKTYGAHYLAALIARSLISVNGAPVSEAQALSTYKSANTKARSLMLKAFTALNGVSDDETRDFLKGAASAGNDAPGSGSGAPG